MSEKKVKQNKLNTGFYLLAEKFSELSWATMVPGNVLGEVPRTLADWEWELIQGSGKL